jgi:hypothetical protein
VSRMTPGSRQTQQLCIEIDKMLRFSHWLFAEKENKQISPEDQPSDPEANGQSAA